MKKSPLEEIESLVSTRTTVRLIPTTAKLDDDETRAPESTTWRRIAREMERSWTWDLTSMASGRGEGWSRRREWARPREIERPWASDDEGDDGWSSGLETKKNESELKLEEVHSDLAKRVSEVAASWACAGASDWSDLMNSLGKFHIEDQSPERLGGARCKRRCGEEGKWLTGLFRFDPV